ncbi:MAG: S8 family peptidase [Nitriliruptoraceae bacterium]
MRSHRVRLPAVAVLLLQVATVGSVRAADAADVPPGVVVEGPFRAVGPDGFDGWVVRPAEPGLLDQVRSLLTTGRTVDPLAVGADAVADAGGLVAERLDPLGVLVADLSPDQVRAVAAAPGIASVAPNVIVSSDARVATVSDPASWGLGFIDRDYRTAGLDEAYEFTSDGSGVDLYIVDSGIETSHPDFTGRVPAEPAGGWFALAGDGTVPTDDCNGHGTHVAGTAGGNLSGVARGASIIPVKVFLDCARTTSSTNIALGLQWILDRIPEGGLERPAVVNMSLGGLYTDFYTYTIGPDRYFYAQLALSPYDLLVQDLVDAGVTVVVAAGNDSWPALWFTPAHVADAITVGSLGRRQSAGNFGDTSGDAILPATSPAFGMNIESSFSNFGPLLDIYAPGSEITSACVNPNALGSAGANAGCATATVDGTSFAAITIGGTSMAAPHVAGLAARILGAEFAATGTILTPAQVSAALTGGAIDAVRALEADYAAPDIVFTVASVEYQVALADMRNGDGSPNVSFATTDLMLSTLQFEPAGPTRIDAPALQACVGDVAGGSVPLTVGGVAPFSWTASAPAPTGYLTSQGIVAGSLTGAAAGDVTITVTDAFGRSASRSFAQADLPPGC